MRRSCFLPIVLLAAATLAPDALAEPRSKPPAGGRTARERVAGELRRPRAVQGTPAEIVLDEVEVTARSHPGLTITLLHAPAADAATAAHETSRVDLDRALEPSAPR